MGWLTILVIVILVAEYHGCSIMSKRDTSHVPQRGSSSSAKLAKQEQSYFMLNSSRLFSSLESSQAASESLPSIPQTAACSRGDRITMEPPQREICATPKEEAALRFRWERLRDVAEVSEVYTWYKHMQESAITFDIPLMPFRGIVLRQKVYGLCITGMGTHNSGPYADAS